MSTRTTRRRQEQEAVQIPYEFAMRVDRLVRSSIPRGANMDSRLDAAAWLGHRRLPVLYNRTIQTFERRLLQVFGRQLKKQRRKPNQRYSAFLQRVWNVTLRNVMK